MLSADDGQKVGILTKEDAQSLTVEPEEEDVQAYESILEDCMRKIKKTAEDGKEYCEFVIPKINFKLPSYNPDHIFAKLVTQLNDLRFNVVAWEKKRLIIIAWFKNEEKGRDVLTYIVQSIQERDQHENEEQ
jgi:hypothetical protein